MPYCPYHLSHVLAVTCILLATVATWTATVSCSFVRVEVNDDDDADEYLEITKDSLQTLQNSTTLGLWRQCPDAFYTNVDASLHRWTQGCGAAGVMTSVMALFFGLAWCWSRWCTAASIASAVSALLLLPTFLLTETQQCRYPDQTCQLSTGAVAQVGSIGLHLLAVLILQLWTADVELRRYVVWRKYTLDEVTSRVQLLESSSEDDEEQAAVPTSRQALEQPAFQSLDRTELSRQASQDDQDYVHRPLRPPSQGRLTPTRSLSRSSPRASPIPSRTSSRAPSPRAPSPYSSQFDVVYLDLESQQQHVPQHDDVMGQYGSPQAEAVYLHLEHDLNRSHPADEDWNDRNTSRYDDDDGTLGSLVTKEYGDESLLDQKTLSDEHGLWMDAPTSDRAPLLQTDRQHQSKTVVTKKPAPPRPLLSKLRRLPPMRRYQWMNNELSTPPLEVVTVNTEQEYDFLESPIPSPLATPSVVQQATTQGAPQIPTNASFDEEHGSAHSQSSSTSLPPPPPNRRRKRKKSSSRSVGSSSLVDCPIVEETDGQVDEEIHDDDSFDPYTTLVRTHSSPTLGSFAASSSVGPRLAENLRLSGGMNAHPTVQTWRGSPQRTPSPTTVRSSPDVALFVQERALRASIHDPQVDHDDGHVSKTSQASPPTVQGREARLRRLARSQKRAARVNGLRTRSATPPRRLRDSTPTRVRESTPTRSNQRTPPLSPRIPSLAPRMQSYQPTGTPPLSPKKTKEPTKPLAPVSALEASPARIRPPTPPLPSRIRAPTPPPPTRQDPPTSSQVPTLRSTFLPQPPMLPTHLPDVPTITPTASRDEPVATTPSNLLITTNRPVPVTPDTPHSSDVPTSPMLASDLLLPSDTILDPMDNDDDDDKVLEWLDLDLVEMLRPIGAEYGPEEASL